MLAQLERTKIIKILPKGSFFLCGNEYNIESSESLSANEDDVSSSPNLEDKCRRVISPIGHNNWCKKECDLQDPKGGFFVKGRVTTSYLKEAILDNILGDDHVSLAILCCLEDISTIMTIWK
jgi:hypothetical protein